MHSAHHEPAGGLQNCAFSIIDVLEQRYSVQDLVPFMQQVNELDWLKNGVEVGSLDWLYTQLLTRETASQNQDVNVLI